MVQGRQETLMRILDLFAQSRWATFGPSAAVRYGNLTEVQKRKSLFKAFDTHKNEPHGLA
jgi:hypothetical protein